MFPKSFLILKSLVTNAESLNFDKLIKLKVLSELNQIDTGAVTKVQSHEPESLRAFNIIAIAVFY